VAGPAAHARARSRGVRPGAGPCGRRPVADRAYQQFAPPRRGCQGCRADAAPRSGADASFALKVRIDSQIENGSERAVSTRPRRNSSARDRCETSCDVLKQLSWTSTPPGGRNRVTVRDSSDLAGRTNRRDCVCISRQRCSCETIAVHATSPHASASQRRRCALISPTISAEFRARLLLKRPASLVTRRSETRFEVFGDP